jgi:hypothetical protein
VEFQRESNQQLNLSNLSTVETVEDVEDVEVPDTILNMQSAMNVDGSAFGCARYPSRWIPFDETRRS